MPELTPQQYKARLYYQQLLNEQKKRQAKVSPKMTEVSEKNLTDELLRRGYTETDIKEQMNTYAKQETTKFERFKEEIPEMVGGAAYGLALGAAGGPITGVLGAGLGGMAGKAGQQIYRQFTTPETVPKTTTEMAKELSGAGVRQAAYEAAGRAGVGVLSKAIRPIFKKITPELLPGAKESQKQMMKYGSHLTPAQMTESGLLDTIEEVTEKGFLSRGTMHKFKAIEQPKALKQWSLDVADDFASHVTENLSPDEVGIIFRDIFAGENETFKAVGRSMYGQVDKAMGNSPIVSLGSLKQFAQKINAIAKERKGIGDTAAGMSMIKKVLKFSDNVTFKQAQSIRSGLGDEIYAMSISKDKAGGIAKKLYGLMSENMETASKKLGTDAFNIWKKADTFWKESKEAFSNETLRRLALISQKNPEFVSKAVFQNKAVTKIRTVKRLLGDHPEAWQNMKATWVADLFEKGSDVDGVIIGETFQKKLNAMGKEALAEIFTPTEIKNVDLLTRTARMVQQKTGGSGGMLIQLTQSGPIIGLASGALFREPSLLAGGAFLLISPVVVAKMIRSSKMTNWLVQGMRMPNAAPAAGSLYVRISETVRKLEAEQ